MAIDPKKEAADLEAAANTAAAAKPKPKSNSVRLQAVHGRMRNPITGQEFKVSGVPTEIIDIDTPDQGWTRAQIEAGVLVKV